MKGDIAPWARLSEVKLAKQFEVSRTPVREALSRLIAHGMIVKEGGAYSPYFPSFTELSELYELRVALELLGVRRFVATPARHHDTALLQQERAFWKSLEDDIPQPDADFVTRDERFHSTLLEASGNNVVVDALANVNQRIRPVRMFDYMTEDRMDATVTEHLAIIDLLLDNRIEECADFLNKHINESMRVVLERAQSAYVSYSRMANDEV